jgi:hypothetical protein
LPLSLVRRELLSAAVLAVIKLHQRVVPVLIHAP